MYTQKPVIIRKAVDGHTKNAMAFLAAGKYLEIFGRKNNLRNFWVTVGNEVTGTGLPAADIEALQANNGIAGAVYGRAGGK